jgi:hypothetical protein
MRGCGEIISNPKKRSRDIHCTYNTILTLKYAKKIKTHEYTRVVKSLPYTKS